MPEGQDRRSAQVFVAERNAGVGEGKQFIKLDLSRAVPGLSGW
ncbi:hypothetical protein REA19_16630 [Prescottella equi]|nr:hypothetical protein REA19_16630 [Prescottella equi]